jgi:hypothetical protein
VAKKNPLELPVDIMIVFFKAEAMGVAIEACMKCPRGST